MWTKVEISLDGKVRFGRRWYAFEVIRSHVLKHWSRKSTGAGEAKCTKWLIADLLERGVESVSKAQRQECAKAEYGVSSRGFDRCWREALDETGLTEQATAAGRKKLPR
jgi:hypothetical protein